MNADILKLMLLKNRWILVEGKTLIYVHDAVLKRNGDIITFSWNNDGTFTRVFNVNNLESVKILTDVQIIKDEAVESLFTAMVNNMRGSANDGPNTHIQVRTIRAASDKDYRFSKYTRNLSLAKSTKDELVLTYNDGTIWENLYLNLGKIQHPLWPNHTGFKTVPSEFDWAEHPDGHSKVLSIDLSGSFADHLKDYPLKYFEEPTEYLNVEPKVVPVILKSDGLTWGELCEKISYFSVRKTGQTLWPQRYDDGNYISLEADQGGDIVAKMHIETAVELTLGLQHVTLGDTQLIPYYSQQVKIVE